MMSTIISPMPPDPSSRMIVYSAKVRPLANGMRRIVPTSGAFFIQYRRAFGWAHGSLILRPARYH
jgi:hypothetical protein